MKKLPFIFSILIIAAIAITITPKAMSTANNPSKPGSGVINFRNNTNGTLYFYYVITNNNAVINFCSQRILYNNAPMPNPASITIPAGKILNYYFYTSEDCDARFQKAYGVITSAQANGGTININ